MYYRFTMDYGNSVATSAVVVSRDTTHCRGVYKWLSTICFTIIRAWALTKSFFFSDTEPMAAARKAPNPPNEFLKAKRQTWAGTLVRGRG